MFGCVPRSCFYGISLKLPVRHSEYLGLCNNRPGCRPAFVSFLFSNGTTRREGIQRILTSILGLFQKSNQLRYIIGQVQTIPLLRLLNLIPPTLRRLPAPNLPPSLLLQKLLSRLGPVVMQAPPLPRDRLPVARLGNDVAVLADLDGSVLQDGDAVTVPHCAEQGRAHKGLDLEVVVARIVDDAAVERFAGTGWWAGE